MNSPAQQKPVRNKPSPLHFASALVLGAVLIGAPAAAQAGPGEVTPELLGSLLPTELEGLELSWDESGTDRQGSATALVEFLDPGDDMASRHLALRLTDLGPYLDASVLALEADAAAGRLEKTEVAGYPAFAERDGDHVELSLAAGSIGISASSFGPVISLEQLEGYVAALPLSELGSLASSAPMIPPGPFLRGALRSFLPEEVAGFPRASGFYSELHPAGSASSGYGYEGERDGEDVEIVVTIADGGSSAAAVREQLLSEGGWEAFTEAGHDGLVRSGLREPHAVLFVDRFRIEVSVRPTVLDKDELKAVFAEIDTGPLGEFAAAVPPTEFAVDPLIDAQPALASPEALAAALPGEAAGLRLADTHSAAADPDPVYGWDMSMAQGLYVDADDTEVVLLAISDEGVFPVRTQMLTAGMEPFALDTGEGWLDPDTLHAILLVDGRIVITAETAPGAEVASADLLELLGSIDMEALTGSY